MSRLLDYIVGALREPRQTRTRGQQFVRNSWELTVHCWRQLQRHRAEGMAAELTYRTIFSLIPVVVLGLVMFRIVGGLVDVQSKVENQLFSFFGVPEITAGYASTISVAKDTQPDQQDKDTAQADDDAKSGDEARQPGEAAQAGIEVGQPGDERVAIEGGPSTPEQQSGISESAAGQEASDDQATEAIDSEAEVLASEQEHAHASEETRREARASIRRTLHDLTAKVASLDFKSIGVFGVLLFIYAAVALADSVEHLFNRIYDAPAQRPVHLRLAIHWSIITLGSGLLATSLYMSGQFVEWFGEYGAGATSTLILRYLLSVSASWFLLFLLYALMPNTHVSIRAAAIGSLVGSLLWEGAKFGFQVYVTKAVPYSAIYGSIGLIPLFLFWIYVTWLIVLFGLILAYTLQSLHGRPISDVDQRGDALPGGDPDWMLPIMCEVSRTFASGTTISHQELADRLGLTSRITHEMCNKLVSANMLRHVTTTADEDETLTLARPAESIVVADILELAHRVGPASKHPAWKTLAGLKLAERKAADGKTLADLQVS